MMDKTTLQLYKECAGIADNPDQEGLNLFAELIIADLEAQIKQLKQQQLPQFDNTVTFLGSK
jgi:hypothetical protein